MTSRFAEDTALDALAAQVRSFAPLGLAEVGSLLDEAHRSPAGPATGRLVEQQLGAVLDSVLARRGSGADLMELFQEGSVAATVAVGEYATRSGAPAGLRVYVVRVVDSFLDDIIKREAAQRLADTLLLERVKLLEIAELSLRRRLERVPTTLELAAALEWMPEEVAVVEAVLRQARDAYDAEIVDFLDDTDDTDAGNTADI
jgi:DNA-directed RNA polymerase sigma subunit (sigma70/sigma32)